MKTHPWINFGLELPHRLAPSLWMMLGEASSKCEHLAGVPLKPAIAKQLYKVYLAKGVMATTAIEGNTLTEEEVALRIEGNLPLPKSKEYLGREVDNIIEACHQIGKDILGGSPELSAERVKLFNRMVLSGLEVDTDVVPGVIRKHSVGVADYRGAPPEDCDYLLDKLCRWLTGDFFRHQALSPIASGLLRAIVAHVYIAWIHPFADGNGRTARLVEFQVLLEARVPFPAAHLLSNYYNQTRALYYRQLAATSKSGGDLLPFIEYAVRGFVEGLREQLQSIQEQQLDTAWENLVHEQFAKPRAAEQRQRLLALELSRKRSFVPAGKVRLLSPDLAALYATKTAKTVTRDLNRLVKLELAEKGPGGYRARREIMLGYLPPRAPGADDIMSEQGQGRGQ